MAAAPRVPLTEARRERVREMIRDELETAWLYDALAKQSDGDLADSLRAMAATERQHAAHWCGILGDDSPLAQPVSPSLRRRILAWQARFGGLGVVISQLRREELTDIYLYESDPDSGDLAEEEREHRAALAELDDHDELVSGHGASVGASGTFRASLFGFNDGIVSNLALMAGVAGVAVGSDAVIMAGIAGWLAGAFSMAGGEYISMRSQRELHERQIGLELEELLLDPEEERRELERIYRRKGLSRELAEQVAGELMQNPQTALDTLAREELGLDPGELGSPLRAAIGSFAAFSLGALIPLLPFLIVWAADWSQDRWTLFASALACAAALALAGLLTSVITSRNPLYASARFVLVGLTFAAITYAIGAALPFDL